MQFKLSQRITKPDFQGEFTASILAAAASPDLISFAGGLPFRNHHVPFRLTFVPKLLRKRVRGGCFVPKRNPEEVRPS